MPTEIERCARCVHPFTSAGACGYVQADATLCRCEHVDQKCAKLGCNETRVTDSDNDGIWYCSMEHYRDS